MLGVTLGCLAGFLVLFFGFVEVPLLLVCDKGTGDKEDKCRGKDDIGGGERCKGSLGGEEDDVCWGCDGEEETLVEDDLSKKQKGMERSRGWERVERSR